MTNTRDDALEALSNQLRAVQFQLAALKAASDDLKARVRDLVGDQRGVIEAFGKPVLTVTYRKVFNEETARRLLPPDLLNAISENKISAAKAKETLPPALYAQCQVETDSPTITPKVAA